MGTASHRWRCWPKARIISHRCNKPPISLSYVQNTTRMKPLNLLLIAASLPMAALAQSDTLRADTTLERGLENHRLELGLNSKEGAYAQVKDNDDDGNDTIRIEFRHKVIRIISTEKIAKILSADSLCDDLRSARTDRRNAFTYWSGIDFGVNSFMTSDGRYGDGPKAGPLLLNNLRSRWLSINFMEQKYEFGSHHAGLFWGLGLEFTSYHLSENATLAYNGDSTYTIPVEQPQFTKNKLRQIGLRLPLMFEFNTKKMPLPVTAEDWKKYHEKGGFSNKGNFHFAAGVVGSWYFDTMYKQKFRQSGENRKVRDKGDYNLLPYRISARAQIGIGGWNLFAEYGLTPLFEKGTAPEVMPVTVGLTLIGFN